MYNALAVLLIVALAAIVFEASVIGTLRSSDPWIKALPSLVSFAGFIAVVVFAQKKDSWPGELAKVAVGWLSRSLLAMTTVTFLAITAAGLLGYYTYGTVNAKDGRYVVQVVNKADVPGDSVEGLPVELEHKLSSDGTITRRTGADGRAAFEVNKTDVFTVRLHRLQPDRALFIIKSNVRVNDKTLSDVELVRLTDIPSASWIKIAPSPVATRPSQVEALLQLPAEFFRWREGMRSDVLSDPRDHKSNFPFALPQGELILQRPEFTVGFSGTLRLPRWVAHRIVPGPSIQRSLDGFVPDPLLPGALQAASNDYSRNDFDRGHLVRRSDLFGLGEASVLKVSYLSAVVPQLAYVNQKSWFALEERTSALARDGRTVHVIRGPVYMAAFGANLVDVALIGANRLAVPTHFFQITHVSGSPAAVTAHLVPNRYVPLAQGNEDAFRTSVAQISRLTGLTFDPVLKP